MTIVETLILPHSSEQSFQRNNRTLRDVLYCLDEVSEYVVTSGSHPHVAPELLDPWVFFSMVEGLNCHYTINGAASAGNWRLLPAAGRMAARLRLDDFAEEIAKAVSDCASEDQDRLDRYDRNDFSVPMSAEEGARIFHLVDRRFDPFAAEDKCIPPLWDWVEANLPRRFTALETWRDEVEAVWLKVYAAFPDVRRLHVGSRLGSYYAVDLLDAAGIMGARHAERRPHLRPLLPPVGFERWWIDDGRLVAKLTFADGTMLVDVSTMSEIVRIPQSVVGKQVSSEGFLRMADSPRLGLSADGTTVQRVGFFAERSNVLKYRN